MGRLYGNTVQTPNQQPSSSGRLFGAASSPPSSGAEITTDINPISRLFSNDEVGKKKISVFTPFDYLLNLPVYAGAGAIKSGIKKAKDIKKRKDAGENVSILEQITAPSPLNPTNWGGSLENIKAENRQTAFDVVRGEGGGAIPSAIAFAGDLSAPSIPIAKVARATGATKAIKEGGRLFGQTQVGQKVAPLAQRAKDYIVPKIMYRGGQPAAYAERAEQAITEMRQGGEKAKEIGTLLSEGLTRAQQVRLGQIMKGGVTTGKTDQGLIRRANEARKVIDGLSQELVNEAMKGGEKQVTPKGLAADLVNTLSRSFKKPDPTLGIEEKGWRSPDELALELVKVFDKYQPAHAGGMKNIAKTLPSGRTKIVRGFADIGADVRGKADAKGGEEVITNTFVPKGETVGDLQKASQAPELTRYEEAINTGDTKVLDELAMKYPDDTRFQLHKTIGAGVGRATPEPYVDPAISAFTQTSGGFSPVQGAFGVKKRVAEGLPQRPVKKTMLPVETVMKEAETGGIPITDKTVKTIQENMGKYLPTLYRKYEQNPEGLVKFLSTGKGGIIRDRLMNKKDIPDDVKNVMGQILEPAYPAAKGVAQVSNMVAKSKLFRWVNDNFAQAEQLSDDLVQLTDKRYGILAGKWISKVIADDLKNTTIKDPDGILTKALNLWKQGKILYNPATRVRNQISNMMLMSTVGDMPSYAVLNPKTWIDAGSELKNQGALYKVLKKQTSLFGNTFYGNELAPFLDDFTQFQSGNALQRFTEAAKKFPGKSYEWQEELGKMALAKYWIDRGKTVEEAAKIAEDALFNYSKVPPLVRKLSNAPFGYPFLTFQYKALPALGKAVAERPGAIARLTRTGKAVEAEAEAQYGEADSSMLPDFMENGQYLRLPFQSDKRDLYLDLNYLLPWGSIDERPGILGEPQNPAYVLMADVFRNKSAFTKKEIWKETDSDDEKVKKVADYIYKTLMPPLAPAIPGTGIEGGYSAAKIVDAFKQRPDYFGRVRDIPTVLVDVLLGLKATPIDYAETARIKQAQKGGKIRDLQEEIREVQMKKSLFPEEKTKQINELQRKISEESR